MRKKASAITKLHTSQDIEYMEQTTRAAPGISHDMVGKDSFRYTDKILNILQYYPIFFNIEYIYKSLIHLVIYLKHISISTNTHIYVNVYSFLCVNI